jgi:hypothetical protein
MRYLLGLCYISLESTDSANRNLLRLSISLMNNKDSERELCKFFLSGFLFLHDIALFVPLIYLHVPLKQAMHFNAILFMETNKRKFSAMGDLLYLNAN